MIRLFARPLLACRCVLILFSSAAFATDFTEPRGDLTLADAVAAALLRNPALQSANFDVRAADARIAQARQRPNPELGVTLENFGGGLGGTDLLESTLSLSQVIELGGKRERRVAVARYGRDSATIEREATQLDVLAEITRRFIDVAAQQAHVLLLRRGTELHEKKLAAITRRVEAARSPEAEKSRAVIALGRARLETRQTEQLLLSGHRRLAALWGSTEPQFGDAKADLFDLPAVASFAELVGKLRENPDFLRFASQARLRDAEWQLAMAEATSNVTLGAGLRHFEETGDSGFVVNFSMPLPLARSNQGAIREAAIRRDQSEIDREAAFITAQATLFEIYQSLQFARAQVTSLREQLIPQAEAALEQTRYGYERGRFSFMELADTQRELIALQRNAIEAAATYHRARAEIERLTHTSLATTISATTPLTATQD